MPGATRPTTMISTAEMRAERIVTHSPQLFEKLSVKGLASRTRPANAIITPKTAPFVGALPKTTQTRSGVIGT